MEVGPKVFRPQFEECLVGDLWKILKTSHLIRWGILASTHGGEVQRSDFSLIQRSVWCEARVMKSLFVVGRNLLAVACFTFAWAVGNGLELLQINDENVGF